MRSDEELLGAVFDARLKQIEGLEAENAQLRARLAEYERDTRHMIELRDDGWTLQHPLSCRPDLFSCGFNMAAGDTLELGQHPNGRFYCTMDDHMTLVLQEEVSSP
jgi:hypothetical protein